MPAGKPENHNDKLQTQKQWNADPCGASTAPGLEHGSRAFFQKVEEERYAVYAPWMLGMMDFGRFAGQRLLEIGPGLGTDHARMARAGARCVALDLTARHLELTARRFRLEGLQTQPVRGDAETLPFRDECFDGVYSFGVIHHTPDMEAAVEEVRRVLRPGGLAIVGLYHKHSAFYWIHTMLFRGLLLGGLATKGYRRLLAEIEHQSEGSDAVPLVQVLTRSDCQRLFERFSAVDVQTAQIDAHHALPVLPHSSGRVRRLLERVAGRWGWYLVVVGRK